MVVKAEQWKREDEGCNMQATMDIKRAKGRLPMVGKPGVLGVLNCVKCHVEWEGVRAGIHAVSVLGTEELVNCNEGPRSQS